MGNMPTAVLFLIWQLNVNYSTAAGERIALSLPPRFIGYLILLFGCGGISHIGYFNKHKVFFAIMAALETIKWTLELFASETVESVWFGAQVVSISAMVYALWAVTSTAIRVENDIGIDAGSKRIRNDWWLMLATGVLTAMSMSVRSVHTVMWLVAAVVGLKFCVDIFRTAGALKKRM